MEGMRGTLTPTPWNLSGAMEDVCDIYGLNWKQLESQNSLGIQMIGEGDLTHYKPTWSKAGFILVYLSLYIFDMYFNIFHRFANFINWVCEILCAYERL